MQEKRDCVIGCGCIRDSDLSGFGLLPPGTLFSCTVIYAQHFSTFQSILDLSVFCQVLFGMETGKGNVKLTSILANFSPRQNPFL